MDVSVAEARSWLRLLQLDSNSHACRQIWERRKFERYLCIYLHTPRTYTRANLQLYLLRFPVMEAHGSEAQGEPH